MPPRKSTTTNTSSNSQKLSVEEQYFALYSEYTAKFGKNTAILMEVGKFYELYDAVQIATGLSRANVQVVSELCAGAPEPKPTDDPTMARLFWGFPVAAIAKYERLLVNAGYTVVVVDQHKDSTGAVTERKVSYVTSPGTYMDSESLVVSASSGPTFGGLVGIVLDAYADRQGRTFWSVGSAAFDINTGAATSTEVSVPVLDGRPVLDTVLPFWDQSTPSEVVVWTRNITSAPSETHIRSWFKGTGFQGPVHVKTNVPPTTAAATRGAAEFLTRLYKPESALSIQTFLGLSRHPAAFEALTHLLQFIEEHTPSYLTKLQHHTLWEPEDAVVLGNAALEQLAMLPSSNNPRECLLHWLQKAVTAVGKRALRARLLKPLTDIAILEQRQARIESLRKRGDMTRHFQGIHDIARLARTFQLGKGRLSDLTLLLTSYASLLSLADQVHGTSSAAPQEARDHMITVFGTWDLERIRGANTGHALGIGPHHPWRRGVHTDLDAFEDAWSELTKDVLALKRTWEDLLGEADDALKLEFKAEEEMWVFTTTKRRAAALGTVLKQRRQLDLAVETKGASTTVTVTAEPLQHANQKAKMLWSNWTAAVATHWSTAWGAWKGCESLVTWLGELDTNHALARAAEEYGYTRPHYIESAPDAEAGVTFTDLRHPIIERISASSGTPYIPHSIGLGALLPAASSSLDDDDADDPPHAAQGVLLYGVNAAGKSSLSKAIGLAVLMAQVGCPVPASAMTLIPYTHLYTRILGNDNLWAGMSSFVVEMTEFRSILKAASPRTLVLGDELCAGTETVSAMAIVAAGITTLVERGAHFVFATHLHELTTIPEIASCPAVRPYHLSVTSDVRGFLVYDRQLKAGAGCPMYGLEVCRGLDMDPVFMQKATALRKRIEGTTDLTKVSRYNAAVPVQVCHVCGSAKDLEVHHIVPQAAADKGTGRIDVGKHKNDVGNLTVLCESCHDKHHRGDLMIGGWIQTTAGKRLTTRVLM